MNLVESKKSYQTSELYRLFQMILFKEESFLIINSFTNLPSSFFTSLTFINMLKTRAFIWFLIFGSFNIFFTSVIKFEYLCCFSYFKTAVTINLLNKSCGPLIK